METGTVQVGVHCGLNHFMLLSFFERLWHNGPQPFGCLTGSWSYKMYGTFNWIRAIHSVFNTADMISIQPIWIFLAKYWEETQSFILTQKEIIVLNDIIHLLDIFNTVQSLLSASEQLTLPLVIPAYEYLVHLLKHSHNHGGCWLSHAIDAALSKINKYLPGFKLNPLYGIATGVGAFFTWNFSLTMC